LKLSAAAYIYSVRAQTTCFSTICWHILKVDLRILGGLAYCIYITYVAVCRYIGVYIYIYIICNILITKPQIYLKNKTTNGVETYNLREVSEPNPYPLRSDPSNPGSNHRRFRIILRKWFAYGDFKRWDRAIAPLYILCIYYYSNYYYFFNITIYNRQGVCVYLVQFNYSCNSIYTYDIIFVAVNIMYVSPKDKNLQNLSVIQMSSLQVFTTRPGVQFSFSRFCPLQPQRHGDGHSSILVFTCLVFFADNDDMPDFS
jgi:hypothetical protein